MVGSVWRAPPAMWHLTPESRAWGPACSLSAESFCSQECSPAHETKLNVCARLCVRDLAVSLVLQFARRFGHSSS